MLKHGPVRSILFLVNAALISPLAAQSVQIYSELQRVDAFGEILALDRSPSQREIISPATARNSFASFHVAVSVPPGQTYFLYTQANPPNIIKINLYKEQFVNGIPDTLTPTASPSFGVVPDPNSGVPNQTTRDYLLDIYTPPDAEAGRRVRVEILLKFGTWYVVPFELRIMDATVRRPLQSNPGVLALLESPADYAAVQGMSAYLGGSAEWNPIDTPKTVREALRRNAQQDMALALTDPTPLVWLRAATQIVNGWTLFPNGSEWYLRVRDTLLSRPQR
jgi:hypothetical protein